MAQINPMDPDKETKNSSPQLEILSSKGIQQIHQSTLRVLEHTGMIIQHQGIRDLLADNGCWIEDEKVHFPPHLVEWAIRRAPSQALLYDRNGENPIQIGGEKVTYGLGPTLLNMWDYETGKRRNFHKKDTELAARLCDSLSNIDWVMGLGTISDLPSQISDRHEFDAMVRNTTKPLIIWSYTSEGVEDIVEMASWVSGSQENLIHRPFIALALTSLSPLTFTQDALSKIKVSAEYGVPIINTPAPQAGASAPVTIAGQLAIANSENLAGLVITQLIKEGLPYIMGGVYAIMDMKSASFAYGAPEMDLSLAAFMDISRSYGIPTWGTGGCTDSKIVDGQSVVEASLSLITSTFSHANLVHDIGYLESGSTGSLEHIVIANEIIGEIKKFEAEVDINTEGLAEEVINLIDSKVKYSEGGTSGGKTVKNVQTLFSSIEENYLLDIDRTINEKANEKVKESLENHQPEQLPFEVEKKLSDFLTSL